MKLGTSVFLGATGLVCLGLAGVMASNTGCSSSSNNNSSSSGGSSSGTSSSGTSSSGTSSSGTSSSGTSSGSITPPPPSGPTTTITTAHNFALHALHIGDETGSCANGTDWCTLGYNIDGLNTTPTSTNVCGQAADAPKANQGDGNGGIDNSFGQNIVPLIAAVEPNPSSVLTTAIQGGSFTLMLDITGIDTTSTTQTATGLKGAMFGGSHFNQTPNSDAGVPTFTTADDWPLTASFLPTTDVPGMLTPPITSNVNFTNPYVANGTFVSGSGTNVTLALTLSGIPLSLPINDAVITFVNNGSTQPNAKSGIISGVILVSDLINALTPVAGQIATSFCPQADGGVSAAFEQIIVAIQQSADIMHDGTNVAGTPCDAISVGLGFDADEIGAPQYEGTAGPATDHCAPAGDGG
jgi:hypothetical protein